MEKKIEEAIQRATQDLLKDPDWAANTAIIDAINANPGLAQAAVDKTRKRLLDDNPEVAMLALALVDMMVKNCPSTHKPVGSKDFLKAMVKVTDEFRGTGLFRKLKEDETYNRLELKERALVLIQQWAKSFANNRALPLFREYYDKLRNSGVTFPAPHQDELAPVFTPKKKNPIMTAKLRDDKPAPVAADKKVQVNFTNNELRSMSETCSVLCEMLTASDPSENLAYNELIKELVGNVSRGQASVVARITAMREPELLGELIAVNEASQDALDYYNGLVSGKMQRRVPPPVERKEEEPKKVPKVARLPSKDALAALKDEEDSDDEVSKKKKKKKEKKEKKEKKKKKEEASVDGAASNVPKLAAPGKTKPRSRSRSPNRTPADSPQQQPADPLDIFSIPAPGSGGGKPSNNNQAAPVSSAPANGGGFDLDALFGALPEPSKPKDKPKAQEEDDDDPFLALAARTSPATGPAKAPAVEEDDDDDPFAALASR